MTKINQLLAIERGLKNQTQEEITGLYHELAKPQLFAGLSRKYTPKDDDDGDKLPAESVQVQLKATKIIDQATTALIRLIDVTATKDAANNHAKASVVVDGVTIAADVPVTTLMFFEKKLEELSAFVGRLPVLDPTNRWTYDPARSVYVAEPVETVRTKKVPRNHVLAEATVQHPAQVQMFTEDVIVGTWEKTEFSGAMQADDREAIIARLEKLRTAVKFAREEANNTEVTDIHYGADFLAYLFQGGTPQVSG